MPEDLDKAIETARQGIARLRNIDLMLPELRKELEALKARESQREKQMKKTNKKVKRIESGGIAAFCFLAGNADINREKAYEEEKQARLEYEKIKTDINNVAFRITKLGAERSDYTNCQEEYERLYSKKIEEIIQRGGKEAQKLRVLTDNTAVATILLKEIEEAAQAAQQAFDSLNKVLKKLYKSTNGVIRGIDLFGNTNLGKAREEIKNTIGFLSRLQSELADIAIDTKFTINMDGFARFNEMFFSGSIFEWGVETKIERSQVSVLMVKTKLWDTIQILQRMSEQTKAEIEKNRAETEHLVFSES